MHERPTTGGVGMLRLVLPVILIWGGNFAVMRVGVHEIGPFTLAAMRFFIAATPLILFVPRPKVPFGFIASYAATFGLGQFGLLFWAIYLGLPSGMASLLVQLQVVFTPILALSFLKQRIPAATTGAIVISLLGLGIILSGTVERAGLLPMALGVGAALSWGASNVVISWGAARGLRYNPVSLVAWASMLLPLPFLALAGISGEFEGLTVARIIQALPPAIYLGLIATVIAYYFWVKALATYKAANVAPFTLLIPIIGLILGNLLFAEALDGLRLIGSVVIITGILIHMVGIRIEESRSRKHS